MSRYDSLVEDCALSIGAEASTFAALGNTRILITGGTGFVGSWVAEMIAFLNDRHKLGVHLTLLSPHASEFSERAPHLAGRSDITLMEGDVRNISAVPTDTDWIIHAAGSPDSRIHLSNPIRTMETIVLGTQNVMQAAARIGGLKRILVLSSGLVCGPQQWESAPLSEESYSGMDCNRLANLYAESKRAAEMIATGYRSQTGLPVVTARPFTFIGPYQLLDRPWAINNFLGEALRGGPIRLQGNGSTVRSYMYGSDMAYWMLRLLVDGRIGAAYNIGSPQGISLKELAGMVADFAESHPRIELNTLPGGELHRSRWLPDVTKAEKDCGLKVRIGLDAAIRRTIAWHTGK